MTRQIVAISINKVQVFLYNTIKGYSSDAEIEDNTLKTIQSASEEISGNFKKLIRNAFDLKKEDEILLISGKAYFFSDLSHEKIQEILINLYQFYYYYYKGQVQLKYACFSEKVGSNPDQKLELIKRCTNDLKSTVSTNRGIEDNQKILFQFPDEKYREILKKNKSKELFNKNDEENKNFLSGLNDFVPIEQSEDKKSYRIAIIKADIDKMGEVFQNQESYNEYKRISEILEEKISISNLEKQIQNKGKSIKMLPFYVAGDDIFFAVPVNQIFKAVNLLEAMLKDINGAIESTNPLALSIGIDITQNDQPIRYYYERVERQLLNAKKAGKKCAEAKISISFDDIEFFIYKNESKEKQDKQWSNLLWDIGLLNRAMKKSEALTSSYFYNLLKILENETFDKDNIAYTNAVFYRLLPSVGDISAERFEKIKEELMVKSLLMQLLEDSVKKRKPKCIVKINDENKKRLKNRVRLFLLFSDERYQTVVEEWNQDDFNHLSQGKIITQSYVSPICTYLFETSLKDKCGRHQLRDQIVKKIEEKGKRIAHFPKIKIEKSLFFKMKRKIASLQREKAIEDIAIMLDNVNESIVDIEKGQEEIEAMRARTRLSFKKDEFIKQAKDNFDERYIDSLLVFYEYKKLTALKRFGNISKPKKR